MIEVRCLTHLHFKVEATALHDGGQAIFQVRCQWCKNRLRRPTVHEWTLAQVRDARRRGRDVIWPIIRREDVTPH